MLRVDFNACKQVIFINLLFSRLSFMYVYVREPKLPVVDAQFFSRGDISQGLICDALSSCVPYPAYVLSPR